MPFLPLEVCEETRFILTTNVSQSSFSQLSYPNLKVSNFNHKVHKNHFGGFSSILGMLEITNCKSQLPRGSLGFGSSTKEKKSEAAGCFGDGGKSGPLSLLREGYQYEKS